MDTTLIVFLGAATAGAAIMVMALARSRRVAPEIGTFLDGLAPSDHELKVAVPFLPRMAGIIGRAVGRRLERLLPRTYLANVEAKLAQAGMTADRRAGEQVARQIGLGIVGLALGIFFKPMAGTAGLVMLPVMGFVYPGAKVKRAIDTRASAIFKDLPDIIDMLAVAVEAGSGFEQALSIVVKNFHSPMADELGLMLREMELGLPRRQALQELKRRMDIDVVRTFVIALVQADALGIPIGRVLKTQANEVRSRRKAWAREKAGKLPVKILFPLVLFIFPPILAIALGPAVSGFTRLGGGS